MKRRDFVVSGIGLGLAATGGRTQTPQVAPTGRGGRGASGPPAGRPAVRTSPAPASDPIQSHPDGVVFYHSIVSLPDRIGRVCSLMNIRTWMNSIALLAALLILVAPVFAGDAISYNMSGYKTQDGLSATAGAAGLIVNWRGDDGQDVRLSLAVNSGVPTIKEIALRRNAGVWTVLAGNVTPDYSVMTGLRRMSNQQLQPLYGLGIKVTQDVLNKYRWDPFWDAPFDLSIPRPNASGQFGGNPPPVDGLPGTDQPGLPRKADEIQEANASYAVKTCNVKSEGARLTVSYPGVKMGVFDGRLEFTVFKGTNLIRQEVIATTQAAWVAYKYDAGLKGLPIQPDSHVLWRDTGNNWQDYALGGNKNADKVPLTANNRIVIAQRNGGSIAAFPPPHKFFWSREVAINMGYDWYRKDSDGAYSFGIRQNDHEDPGQGQGNWALYSARPGTWQMMTVFLYPSLSPGKQAVNQALAFTHGDQYKPLAGYQVMQHHYHMDLGQRLLDAGNLSEFLPDLQAIKALGVNIVSQIDSVMLRGFSDTGAPTAGAAVGGRGAPVGGAAASGAAGGRAARADQITITAASVQGARISSGKGFLVLANQEVFGSPLGGHTDLLFPHPVYWDQAKPGQSFEETSAKYGKVYHVADANDFMKMVDAEDILISMPHPRTKGSTGFPDAIKGRDYFNDPHYHGFGLRWGMGIDGSEKKTCEYRCLPLLDDMTNWVVDRPEPLKYAISISEVRHQQPGDDIYSGSPVTYLHLKDLPPANAPTPVIDALMKGDMFVTTGEVLVPNFEVRGTGNKRTIVADVEWTFPLDSVEIVWGDGKSTGHREISTKDLPPFGFHHFEIPFDAQGKKWVRFAAWDSAYEGAILEPQRLGAMPKK